MLLNYVTQAPLPADCALAAYRAPAFRVSESDLEALVAEARSISAAIDSPQPLAALVSTNCRGRTVPFNLLFSISLRYACVYVLFVKRLSVVCGR